MQILNKLVKLSLRRCVNNDFVKKSGRVSPKLSQLMCFLSSSSTQHQYKLLEVGVFNNTKAENYQAGQVEPVRCRWNYLRHAITLVVVNNNMTLIDIDESFLMVKEPFGNFKVETAGVLVRCHQGIPPMLKRRLTIELIWRCYHIFLQIFLHKLFGYRGVILFPWTANVIEKDDDLSASTHDQDDGGGGGGGSGGGEMTSAQYDKITADELDRNDPSSDRKKSTKLTYYQVLIDNRDIPYIKAQPDSVTFLSGPLSNRTTYSIHGLDYVSHNDVLPYTSTEKVPIIHELFDKFLMHDLESSTRFLPRDTLKSWQESNHPWLELNDICIKTTNNIKVTVIPFYIGIREEHKKRMYWWRYSIRIENLNPSEPVTLRERHWRIFSQAGTFETVRGRGVISQEPYLNAEYPVFQYHSHVNLQASSGHMWGTFKMERDDGTYFEAKIPSFYLQCKGEEKKVE